MGIMVTKEKNPHAVALGHLGGAVKSEAKEYASHENGAQGGRPTKLVMQIVKECGLPRRTGDGVIVEREYREMVPFTGKLPAQREARRWLIARKDAVAHRRGLRMVIAPSHCLAQLIITPTDDGAVEVVLCSERRKTPLVLQADGLLSPADVATIRELFVAAGVARVYSQSAE